jgi:hypothetical protein
MNIIISSPVRPENMHILGSDPAICELDKYIQKICIALARDLDSDLRLIRNERTKYP